ncbi:hypothetical protein [Gordonia liuliyuniae]|uniref:hypothetical protein n=1 Tax=Gordonia liuliyuniae TaxID=2911517 RepID=UPI0027E0329F|nr:hypothetical protein [Gordonia liuliyuniae]
MSRNDIDFKSDAPHVCATDVLDAVDDGLDDTDLLDVGEVGGAASGSELLQADADSSIVAATTAVKRRGARM